MIIKTRIRWERCKKFATAKELAIAAGIEPRRYLKFEAGEQYRCLTRSEVEKLGELLNVAPDVLADERGRARFSE